MTHKKIEKYNTPEIIEIGTKADFHFIQKINDGIYEDVVSEALRLVKLEGETNIGWPVAVNILLNRLTSEIGWDRVKAIIDSQTVGKDKLREQFLKNLSTTNSLLQQDSGKSPMHMTISYSEFGYKTLEERDKLIKERLLQLDIKSVRCDSDSYMFTVNDNLAMNELVEEFGQKTVYDVIKELNLLNSENTQPTCNYTSEQLQEQFVHILERAVRETKEVGTRRGFVQFIGRQHYPEFGLVHGDLHHRKRVVDMDICSTHLNKFYFTDVPKLQKDSHNPKYSITSNGGRREVVMGKAGNHYPIPKKRW